LRNWTQGNWVNGTKNPAGQPSIYGANFQAITFAQQNYGYLDGVGTPSPELAAAFDAADSRLGTFLDDLANARVQHSTLVLIGSKQGQGPIDPKTLVVTDPQTVIDGANVPVAYFVGEDGGIVIDFPPFLPISELTFFRCGSKILPRPQQQKPISSPTAA